MTMMVIGMRLITYTTLELMNRQNCINYKMVEDWLKYLKAIVPISRI